MRPNIQRKYRKPIVYNSMVRVNDLKSFVSGSTPDIQSKGESEKASDSSFYLQNKYKEVRMAINIGYFLIGIAIGILINIIDHYITKIIKRKLPKK